MNRKVTSAGYIIQDSCGYAIFGVGQSVDDAWASVADAAAPFFDRFGNEISEGEAYETQFKVYGAPQALMDRVFARGGAIAWRIVDGVACTPEEAESTYV